MRRWRTMVVLVGWALALRMGGYAQSTTPAWAPAGPGSVNSAVLNGAIAGPITGLAAAPDGSIFASGLGGVWRWSPGAGTWALVSDPVPVATLTLANGTLYAGTGSAIVSGAARAGEGIEISTDGVHWSGLGQTMLAGLVVTRVAVDPANAAHLLAVASSVPDSPAGAQPGLYASTDGGQNWTLVLSGTVWDVAWDVASDEALVATGTALEISAGGLAPFAALAGVTTSGRVVLSAGEAGGFLALWLGANPQLDQISVAGQVSSLALPPSFTNGETTGLALAANATQIWVGAKDLWTNAGHGWTDLSLGVPAPQQHAILSDGGGDLWVGNDAGVWMAPPGGALQNKNQGLKNFAVSAFASTSSGGVASWAGDAGGFGAGALAATSVWSADGSHEFSLLAASGTAVYGVARGSSQLLASSDGGATWKALSAGAYTGTITALAAGNQAVWLGTSSGQAWDSSDGGASWEPAASLPSTLASGITALAIGGSTVWIGSGKSLWSSSDGGVSWTASPQLPAPILALAAAPVRVGAVVAATAIGAELLFDGSWNALPGLAAPISALVWDGSDALWAATLGSGFWSLPLGQFALQLAVAPTTATAVAGGDAVPVSVQASDLGGPAAGVAIQASTDAGWNFTATTGSSGAASLLVPVPQRVGTVTLLANAAGAWGPVSASMVINVGPGALSQIQVVAGSGMSGQVGTTLDISLETEDTFGNPVPGVSVVLGGPGTFSPAAVVTGNDGRASFAYTFPMTAGAVTLTATAGGVQTQWPETAQPAPSYTLALTPPSAPVPPGQTTAAVQVQVVPGPGGYTSPVSLSCQPVPGCSFSAATVTAPYPPVTMTVDLASRTADQSSLPVAVTTDATHSATGAIPLQGFSLAASANSLSVNAGEVSAPLTLTLAPVNGMAGSVSFAAAAASGALPAWLVPVFTPGSASLPQDGSVRFAVSATAASLVPATWGWPRPWQWLVLVCALAAAGWRRRWRLAPVLAGVMLCVACGGGGGGGAAPAPAPPTPTVTTYTVQLTATAGALQASVPVQISVTSH